jgi:N-methylhydantoinase B
MRIYVSDAEVNPPKGVRGGQDGRGACQWKYDVTEPQNRTELPAVSTETLKPNERIVSESAGGGGYGDPLQRDPELVRWKAREEYISVEKAREVYGVVLDTKPERYGVDYEATKKLREELKKKRGKVNEFPDG